MAVELENGTDLKELAAALLNEMNQQKAAQTPCITMKEFATIYLERHSKAHNKTWKSDESRLRLHILPAFADRQLTAISTADIVEFQAAMVGKGVEAGNKGIHQANRCTEQLGHMFRQARTWGYFPEERRLPTEGVKAFRELSRERFVDHDEMERLAVALNEVESERMRVLLWLHLLTGMRTTNLRNLKWCEVDGIQKQLNKSAEVMKSWKPLSQPLSSIALEMISKLPKTGPFVFSEDGAAKPYNKGSVYKVFNRVRKRANLPDIRIHDLRRTVGSWLAQSGVPMALIAKVLHHSDMRATEIYARFANDDARAALEAHAAALNRHVNVSQLVEGGSRARITSDRFRQTVIPAPAMPSVINSLKRVSAPHLKAFFWLYLLTGLSKSELHGSKWADYDEAERVLSIPAERSHSGKPIRQPLSAVAAEKLEALPTRAEFIFCAKGGHSPVNDHVIRQSWDGVRRRAGLPHLDLRALKNTAVTLLHTEGVPADLVVRITNKKPQFHTEKKDYSTEEIRAALEVLSAKVKLLSEHSTVERL